VKRPISPCLRPIRQDSTTHLLQLLNKYVLICPSHGNLGHFTASLFGWNEASWDGVGWDGIHGKGRSYQTGENKSTCNFKGNSSKYWYTFVCLSNAVVSCAIYSIQYAAMILQFLQGARGYVVIVQLFQHAACDNCTWNHVLRHYICQDLYEISVLSEYICQDWTSVIWCDI